MVIELSNTIESRMTKITGLYFKNNYILTFIAVVTL